MQLISRLKNTLNNDLIKNIGIVFGESVFSKFFNFLTILILSRYLGPEEYGKFSFIYVLVFLFSAIFDFGVENTAVRFASTDNKKLKPIFGIYFIFKLLMIGIFVCLSFWVGEKLLLMNSKQDLVVYLPFLVVGFCSHFIFLFNSAYLQAKQSFVIRAWINTARFFLCFVFVFAIWQKNIMNLDTAMYFFLIPLLLSLLFFPEYKKIISSAFDIKIDKQMISDILEYLKWSLNICISYNLLSRLDFIMLSFLVDYKELGVYNIGFQLAAVVSFIPVVFNKVMLPKFSEMKQEELYNFVPKVFRPFLFVSLIIFLILPLTQFVVPLLLGDKYIQAIPVLNIFLIGTIFMFLVVPFEQVFYSINRPKVVAMGRYFQIVVIVFLNLIFIPLYGILAAALSVLVARCIFFTYLVANYYKAKNEYLSHTEALAS